MHIWLTPMNSGLIVSYSLHFILVLTRVLSEVTLSLSTEPRWINLSTSLWSPEERKFPYSLFKGRHGPLWKVHTLNKPGLQASALRYWQQRTLCSQQIIERHSHPSHQFSPAITGLEFTVRSAHQPSFAIWPWRVTKLTHSIIGYYYKLYLVVTISWASQLRW